MANPLGHGLVEPQEEEDGGGAQPWQEHAQPPHRSAEQEQPRSRLEEGVLGPLVQHLEEGERQGQGEDKPHPGGRLPLLPPDGLMEEGGHGAENEPGEEGHGGPRGDGKQVFHHPGQEDKPHQSPADQREEETQVPPQGGQGVGEQLDHRLIQPEGQAEHPAADPREDGPGADDHPLEQQEPHPRGGPVSWFGSWCHWDSSSSVPAKRKP